jgi:FixJ family two-component response regulator
MPRGSSYEGTSRRRHKVPLLGDERSFSLTKRHRKLTMNVLDSGNVPKTVRIALIDDDSSMRKALGRLLCTHGFVCTTYESGEAALADPDLLRMDCLVVDIQLGGINGIELCERVQELGLSIPHVFITACVDRNLPEYPSFMRDSILLVKPIEENDLVESIQRSLASRL